MTTRIPELTDAVEALLFPQMRAMAERKAIGHHYAACPFAKHYRERAAKASVHSAAKQLRKQGIDMHTALSVLAHRGRG